VNSDADPVHFQFLFIFLRLVKIITVIKKKKKRKKRLSNAGGTSFGDIHFMLNLYPC